MYVLGFPSVATTVNVGDVPEDVPAKMSGWLFAKCESIPKVGFEMNYVASYTMIDEETDFTASAPHHAGSRRPG